MSALVAFIAPCRFCLAGLNQNQGVHGVGSAGMGVFRGGEIVAFA